MKSSLNKIAVASSLFLLAAPQASAEEMVNDQRGCIQKVIEGNEANSSNCTEEEIKRPELSPDSPKAIALFSKLKERLKVQPEHYQRLGVVSFDEVRKALEANPAILHSLYLMEQTGGEPDVIAVEDNAFIFGDVSENTPKGRTEMTFEEAKEMAQEMGVQIMDEATYKSIQGEYRFLDRRTFSHLVSTATAGGSEQPYYGRRGHASPIQKPERAQRRKFYWGWRGMLKVKRVN